MRRRDFIAGLGVAVVLQPSARAQGKLPVIGFLNIASEDKARQTALSALRRGLADTGYIEGRNVTIEYRWAEGRNDRLPALASELVQMPVTVIAAVGGTQAAVAAKAATSSIPIVFQIGSDPVEFGFVASLNRPGGNMTGVTSLSQEMVAKRLELLHQFVPGVSSIALLVNPASPFAKPEARISQAAAELRGARLTVIGATDADEIRRAFEQIGRDRVGALVVGDNPLFLTERHLLAELAARHAIPAIYQWRDVPAAGGLMSYGADLQEAFRIVGIDTGRILKGEKPADLPVQQATKFEFAVNLKTAKVLGLTIPLPLLALADEVIE